MSHVCNLQSSLTSLKISLILYLGRDGQVRRLVSVLVGHVGVGDDLSVGGRPADLAGDLVGGLAVAGQLPLGAGLLAVDVAGLKTAKDDTGTVKGRKKNQRTFAGECVFAT